MNRLKNVIIIDTETGGLDPLKHSLMTIGLISGDGRLKKEITVAEPEIVSDPRALAVNRLDPIIVAATGVTPEQACNDIDDFLTKAHADGRPMVCGHNIAFDLAFMRRLYTMVGRPVPQCFSHRTLDTHSLMWSLIAVGRLPATVTGSDAAFAYFDIEPPSELRHTALGDAVATRDLLERLLDLFE